jgi:class 3 adenylate cyclase/tetratricopeptide (TPR) repeat protein
MQMVVCPNCSEENPAKFRLCGYCGTSLVAELPPQELRKVVTIVFSDLKGSTALGEKLDPEAVREVEARYFEAMRAPLLAHGGTLEKYIGDAIMAVFGFPRVREDDALRAVRAAYGMQRALATLNLELEREYGVTLANRTGVNTGPVVANADPNANQQIVTGDTVNVAARLEQAAPAQEVLIGEMTYQLVRDHVSVEAVEPLELKGKAERVPGYRLLDVRTASAGAEQAEGRGAPTPFMGRSAELGRLTEALDEVEDFRACRLRLVVGDAGVGKSRLIREFRDRTADRARIVRGRCLPYGDGITFWPLVEIVREAAGIEAEDTPAEATTKIASLVGSDGGESEEGAGIVERVASAVGLSTARFPVSELFWGARKLLEGLARSRPLVMAIDDLHAAEPTFLEFLDHLVESVRGHAILIIASARVELQETHAGWWDAQAANRMLVRPLGEAESGRIIETLLPGGQVDAAVRARIVEASEGNPLFMEQVVSMLLETGALHRDGERWVASADVAELAVPPSINALLAARLDHLAREERAVLEPASVIGLTFPMPAVAELVPEMLRGSVNNHLMALARKRFVRPDASDDQDAYRFSNLLVRDTAYGSLLKRARVQLHERFVEWAERVNKERGREQEFEEILGYHLEQAYRYRADLGKIDDEGRVVGERAAAKLGAAGRRAQARGDIPASINLLRRAVGLLPREGAFRLELMVDLGEALLNSGSFDDAGALLDEADAIAREIRDDRLVVRAALIKVVVDQYRSGGEGGAARAIETARHAIEVLEPAGDTSGLARAWRLLMNTEIMQGHLDEASAAADRVVEFAGRAGDSRLASRSAPVIASILLRGPTPVAEAIPRCQELREGVKGDRKVEAVIDGTLAVLHAMAGDFGEARALYRRGQSTLIELGAGIDASAGSIDSSRVEILAGDPAAAERELRRDHDALAEIDETFFRSSIAARLAHVLWVAGDHDGALRYADEAEQIGDADDVDVQVNWRTARAKVLAARGEAATARDLAMKAVEIAAETADGILRSDALIDLGEVLALIGSDESSGPPFREALALLEQKGDVVSAGRLRSRLGVSPTG